MLFRESLLQNRSLITWNLRIGPSPSTARARNNAKFLSTDVCGPCSIGGAPEAETHWYCICLNKYVDTHLLYIYIYIYSK